MNKLCYTNPNHSNARRARILPPAQKSLAILALLAVALMLGGIAASIWIDERAIIALLFGLLLWANVGKVASKMEP